MRIFLTKVFNWLNKAGPKALQVLTPSASCICAVNKLSISELVISSFNHHSNNNTGRFVVVSKNKSPPCFRISVFHAVLQRGRRHKTIAQVLHPLLLMKFVLLAAPASEFDMNMSKPTFGKVVIGCEGREVYPEPSIAIFKTDIKTRRLVLIFVLWEKLDKSAAWNIAIFNWPGCHTRRSTSNQHPAAHVTFNET